MKNTKITICFILIFIISSNVSAQINIEKFRSKSDKLGFSGTIKLNFTMLTGNKEVKLFGLESRTDYQAKGYYTFLVAKGGYGWQGGKQFSNEALLHLRYVLKTSTIINPEVFVQIDYNKARLLLFRSLEGGGLRFVASQSQKSALNIGISIMYEHEKLDLPLNSIHPREYSNIRLSTYLSYYLALKKGVSIASVVYYQPKINYFADTRLLSENSLLVSLTEHVGLAVEFNLRFDSKPPDNVHALDTKTKIGFSYRF